LKGLVMARGYSGDNMINHQLRYIKIHAKWLFILTPINQKKGNI